MPKSVLLLLMTLLILSASAHAGIYRCTLQDGSVVYGDKPVYLSDDYCQEVVEKEPQNPYRTQPGQRSGNRPATQEVKGASSTTADEQVAARKILETAQDSSATPFETIENQAKDMVDNFKTARTKRYRESYLKDKQKAMREITALKKEKTLLLKDLPASGLSATQQEEIRKILAEIPE